MKKLFFSAVALVAFSSVSMANTKDPGTGKECTTIAYPATIRMDSQAAEVTDDDLYAMAGHILLQPKIVTEKWGGGKIYY